MLYVTSASYKPILRFLNSPINDQRSSLYRNRSIDLQCKSIDWFLYDEEQWSLLG